MRSVLGRLKTIIMILPVVLLVNCSIMDDNSLPAHKFNQIQISDFEVNMQRNYIRGKIQNNGEHDITSSIFNLEIYRDDSERSGNSNLMSENTVTEYTGKEVLNPENLLLSQNFVVREPLNPGYSTEFYFELKLDYQFDEFLYTHKIVQLKGR